MILLATIFIVGCADKTPHWNSEMPYQPTTEPQVGDILHLASGFYISKPQMLTNATRSRIIYVAETHDNPASHRLELQVLQAMQDKNPGKTALGMEMFTTDQQDILDNWVAGTLSEKEFLRQSKWFSAGWNFAFDYYRDILWYCRDHSIPVIGLNINKKIARQASMTPMTELPPEIQRQLPEMDMNDPYQLAMVEAMLAGHHGGSQMIGVFHRRQTLWDETMAQSVAGYLQNKPEMNMVVVAGGWHIEYGFGIPRRVFQRLPHSYTIIGSKTIKIAEGKNPQTMNVTMPQFPMLKADYMVFLEYELPPKEKVHLGVLLDDKDDEAGVLVAGVMPGSTAANAGIMKNERIIGIDGETVIENFDIIYTIKNKSPGDTATLVILGDGVERQVEVTFIADNEQHHGKK
jgi:uncharacterized iron-regulated protein